MDFPFTAQSEVRLAQLFQPAQQRVEDSKLDSRAAWFEARNLLRQCLRRELARLLEFAGSRSGDSAHEKALADQVTAFNAPGTTVKPKLEEPMARNQKRLGRENRRRRRFPSASATSGRLPTERRCSQSPRPGASGENQAAERRSDAIPQHARSVGILSPTRLQILAMAGEPWEKSRTRFLRSMVSWRSHW